MPEKETLERANQDKREGKAPSTQAGEFVREEIEHIREGKAWGTLNQAGNCHRALEGASRWSGASTSERGRDFHGDSQAGVPRS